MGWVGVRIGEWLPRTEELLDIMALTQEFKHTVAARAQRDPRFRKTLFTEALNAYFADDSNVGNTILGISSTPPSGLKN